MICLILLNLLHIVRSVQFAAHSFICLFLYILKMKKQQQRNYNTHKNKNKTLHMNAELQKNYHKDKVWGKGRKENSHEKVSQSLFLLRTQVCAYTCRHTCTYTQAHIHHAHVDTKFLLFVVINVICIAIKKLQQS